MKQNIKNENYILVNNILNKYVSIVNIIKVINSKNTILIFH